VASGTGVMVAHDYILQRTMISAVGILAAIPAIRHSFVFTIVDHVVMVMKMKMIKKAE